MLICNEKEGRKNDISLPLDLINVKDGQNFYVGVWKPRLSVLGCLEQYHLNETSNCVVFIFFPILRFEIRGAAYLWMRLLQGRLWYIFIYLHSMETALLKVMNDVLLKINLQHVTLLILLDLAWSTDQGFQLAGQAHDNWCIDVNGLFSGLQCSPGILHGSTVVRYFHLFPLEDHWKSPSSSSLLRGWHLTLPQLQAGPGCCASRYGSIY